MIKLRFPVLLTLIAMFGGIFISILFGANEDFFKNRISAGLQTNAKIQSIQDPQIKSEKIKVEHEKNWRYYQRYHFHATAISTMTLSLLIFLGFIEASRKETLIASYMLAVGGFLYPFVWLFAGIFGPEMGRDEAKEAFAIFGYMGGVYLLGLTYTIYLAVTKNWYGIKTERRD